MPQETNRSAKDWVFADQTKQGKQHHSKFNTLLDELDEQETTPCQIFEVFQTGLLWYDKGNGIHVTVIVNGSNHANITTTNNNNINNLSIHPFRMDNQKTERSLPLSFSGGEECSDWLLWFLWVTSEEDSSQSSFMSGISHNIFSNRQDRQTVQASVTSANA